MNPADIGVIGLGVYHRTAAVSTELVAAHGQERPIMAAASQRSKPVALHEAED